VAALDDARPYRGSSNQRLHQLSDRYSAVFDAYYSAPHGRRIEINIGLRTMMVGVPSTAQLNAWLPQGRGPWTRYASRGFRGE
jgi:hypothetical protein